jgi:ketose-bisphosphate aldolase
MMALVPMLELLERARTGGYAVPAFCVWNLETMKTVLGAARELRAPVILMCGPGEFSLLSPAELSAAARVLMDRLSVPAALHLDHGNAMEQVRECIEAGFTSVMLDCSTQPFEENAAALREVAEMAHPRGITVEGEIGHVGRADGQAVEGQRAESTLTDPEEAARYAEASGVDALAVSIGNAHGQYTRLPRLDFVRLAAIRERVSVPLVLHGGSGTPPEDLRRAISLGVAKVNVATELVQAVRGSLLGQWQSDRNPWAPMALVEAMGAMGGVAREWIRRVGAEGRVAG